MQVEEKVRSAGMKFSSFEKRRWWRLAFVDHPRKVLWLGSL
jgi:hypothetical protein